MIIENEHLIHTTSDGNFRSRFEAKSSVSSAGYGTMTNTSTGYGTMANTTRSHKNMSSWWRTEEGGETGLAVLLQVMFPFLVSGVGMVCAGFVFDFIVAWPVFIEITEIIIMIPALLGLKGNLEMTLAARLSTASNLGKLDVLETASSTILGNLALLQCQGLVLGSLVAVQAVLVGVINQEEDKPFKLDHAIILLSSAMLTASIASLGLGAIMASVVIAARKLNINPDNMAIPIAEALGDITSLGLMAVLASCLHVEVSEGRFTAYVIIGCYVVVAPVCGYIAWRNWHTRPVMVGGWVPILAAMTISFVAGVILEPAVLQFVIIKRFQTVFNGVGGQLASIQASRISTALHSAEIHEKSKCGAEDDKESMSDAKIGIGSVTSLTSSTTTLQSASPSTPRTDLKKKSSGSTSSLPSYTSPQPSDGGPVPSITSPPPSYTSPLPSYGGPLPSYTSPPPSYSEPDNVSTSSLPVYLPSGDRISNGGSPSRMYFKTNINTSTPIRRSSPAIFPNEFSHMTSNGDSHLNTNQLFCCGSSSDSSTGRLLLLLVLPGQCLFLYLFVLIKNDRNPTSLFVALFLLASLLQVSILIQLAQMMVHWFWSKGWDPDSSAIPYLTALGDLLGVSLLTATCFLLQWLGDDYVLGEDAINGHPNYSNITTTDLGDYTDFSTTHSINYNFNT